MLMAAVWVNWYADFVAVVVFETTGTQYRL